MSDEAHAHEIVIIKRHGGDHDEHHGGVWKIAFADFMTALMAFFLIMWLLAASDKTKATIAHYFNPMQLVDSTHQPHGLSDPKKDSPSTAPKSEKAAGDTSTKTEKSASESKDAPSPGKEEAGAIQSGKRDEAELFKDPYAVLAELAAKNATAPTTPKSKAPTEGTLGGSGAVGIKGGEAYRDPFEPIPYPPGATPGIPEPAPVPPPAAASADKAEPVPPQPQDARHPDVPEPAVKPAPGDLAAKLAALEPQGAAAAGKEPRIEVRHTGDGTLVDITDAQNFSMFASASAEPNPRLVALMEKVGRLLKAEKGRIVVRGFTDGRPFKSDTYDNWRLSAARAHMAHYMLVRGGLDEQRFERIEGYADHHLKNPKDPGSPENRRIEILLESAAP